MDFLTIGKPDTDKMINILIVTDHFTKYAQAYVTLNQMATVVARTLWENFLVHYGWPAKILTDQGKCFESALVIVTMPTLTDNIRHIYIKKL